jgi:hypothetical protein
MKITLRAYSILVFAAVPGYFLNVKSVIHAMVT